MPAALQLALEETLGEILSKREMLKEKKHWISSHMNCEELDPKNVGLKSRSVEL
jgi:hypothetical protein